MFIPLKVVEVSSSGMVSTRKINRRDLLKSSGVWNVLINNITFAILVNKIVAVTCHSLFNLYSAFQKSMMFKLLHMHIQAIPNCISPYLYL